MKYESRILRYFISALQKRPNRVAIHMNLNGLAYREKRVWSVQSHILFVIREEISTIKEWCRGNLDLVHVTSEDMEVC